MDNAVFFVFGAVVIAFLLMLYGMDVEGQHTKQECLKQGHPVEVCVKIGN